jgi:hypothetical protein
MAGVGRPHLEQSGPCHPASVHVCSFLCGEACVCGRWTWLYLPSYVGWFEARRVRVMILTRCWDCDVGKMSVMNRLD